MGLQAGSRIQKELHLASIEQLQQQLSQRSSAALSLHRELSDTDKVAQLLPGLRAGNKADKDVSPPKADKGLQQVKDQLTDSRAEVRGVCGCGCGCVCFV